MTLYRGYRDDDDQPHVFVKQRASARLCGTSSATVPQESSGVTPVPDQRISHARFLRITWPDVLFRMSRFIKRSSFA